MSFPEIKKMNIQLSIGECKVMWVIGAAERLATLGLLSPDIPMRLSAEAVDLFMEIDRDVELLFPNDFEIANTFREIASMHNEYEVDEENTNQIVRLILEYKNNRTELMKYALSHQLT
jgi:hypothetical protein